MSHDVQTRLWLVRHGETEWSLSGKHTSRTDLPLTETGRERANLLRQELAPVRFAAVFRSPMQRAKETCEIAGLEAAAQVDEDLKEWDYGVFEGRTTSEIQAELPGWSVWTDPIEGGETLQQVGNRADAMIERALAVVPAGNVALFAHAHILRILAARWIRLAPAGGALFMLSTGSLSILGHERHTPTISLWNRTFEL
jgi:broad specificity phosphatase PhoE